MPPTALSEADFALFAIEGFAPRMEALKATLRPRLTAVAARLAPRLGELAGQEMFVHVAKHARRTVNPPAETWAAFAPVLRGYKQLPHFALCVARSGVHARLVLKDEALAARKRLAAALARQPRKLGGLLAAASVRDYGRWDTLHAPPVLAADPDVVRAMAAHAALKTGHFDAGLAFGPWPGDEALVAAFRALLPLYALAVKK